MTSVGGMNGLSLETTVVASPQQVSCDVANEAVLLSMRDGEYYGLNEVAASIWRLLQQPRTVLEIRDILLDEYSDIDPDECERAVLGFLGEMIALNLVELP